MITQKELKDALIYSPETGVFRWKKRTANRIHVGDIAGCPSSVNGYVSIGIYGRLYLAHRLAYVYMTGAFPEKQIDHIDHSRKNNKWANLRASTNQENSQNISLRKNNTSGTLGVYLYRRTGMWMASITVNGETKHLGTFKKKSDAIVARKAANAKYGFHPNHGS